MSARLVALAALISLTACGQGPLYPTQPSPNDPQYEDVARDVLANWSPYIGVHATGEAFDVYQELIPKLVQKGTLRGVRLEIAPEDYFNNHVIRMIEGLSGVEILMLVGNGYLFDDQIEQRIDEIFAAYPGVRYFQIGNEITTILPRPGPQVSIEEYMAKFNRVYDHVQAKHPGRAVLVTQATLGAGNYGARELEKMAKLGLDRMSPDKVILGLNCYSPAAASQYAGVLTGPLRKFRVWVTESGDTNPDTHHAHVSIRYRELRNALRAERIYWYAMWTGDSGMDEGFGLIRQPGKFPNYLKMPLLKILLGEQP